MMLFSGADGMSAGVDYLWFEERSCPQSSFILQIEFSYILLYRDSVFIIDIYVYNLHQRNVVWLIFVKIKQY